jgi:hypothetical protein
LVAHGFTIANIVELVRAGFATATSRRVIAGSRTMESRPCGSPTLGDKR